MVEAERNEDLYRRWWIRMRRAFDIPDLVTDEHAREAIEESIDRSVIIQNLPYQKGVIVRIVEELLSRASQGELDYLIVGDVLRPHLESRTDALSLPNLIRHLPGGTPVEFTHETSAQLLDVAQGVIDRMTDNIIEKPFENDNGGYFNSGSLRVKDGER